MPARAGSIDWNFAVAAPVAVPALALVAPAVLRLAIVVVPLLVLAVPG